MSRKTNKQPKGRKKRKFEFSAPTVTGIAFPSPNCNPNGPGAQPGTNFVDNGGKKLSAPWLLPIFWGSDWPANSPTHPSIDQVVAGVREIVSSPYESALSQWGVGRAEMYGGWPGRTISILNEEPPNPFTVNDVLSFIIRNMNNGIVAEPDDSDPIDTVYCVFMPYTATHDDPPGFQIIGENFWAQWTEGYSFPFDWSNSKHAYFMWVGGRTLDDYTTVFSHELVEILTCPEGDGIVAGPGTPGCPPTGDCQIGDVCTGICDFLNGAKVQAYWSQSNNACVIPRTEPDQ
jgi:hypothetical protein